MSDPPPAGTHEFFAACPRHVPDILAAELRALGIRVTREHPAGVGFDGTLADGYRACLESRTASRVLLTLGTVPLDSADAMYGALKAMHWEDHLGPDGTLAVEVVGEGPSWIRNTQFVAQKAKDAIADRFRERCGTRPSVDLAAPDLRVSLRLARSAATVGIDLSGEPLHRRGYRQSAVEAPLKENLAAALLMRCGWPAIAAEGGAFADPMCGSGTLVIEAALIAANAAPGLLRRRFGFERWLGHDASVWSELRAAAEARRSLAALGQGRLRGFDRDQNAIRAALANANRAGLGDYVWFERRDVASLPQASESRGLVLVNPPYGARLEDERTLGPLYGVLGRTLVEKFPGWEAGVFTGNPPLGRALGLRAYRSHTFFNGPIECRLLRFELGADAVERDVETVRRERLEAARARPGAQMFANRLAKNLSRLESWARREDVSCFRVYDADMPEYAFAVDIYGNGERHACVQEYAAPPTVSRDAARGRRDEALSVLPEVLGLPADRVTLKVRTRQRHGGQYEKADSEARFHVVREGRYRFLVNFTDYLDTGLFLDHRITRRRIGELAAGRRFLNLFAYTGTATVYAAGGGATGSTTVDLSNTYLDWAKRNLALNDLAGPQHGFVHADCLAWLDEQAATGRNRYGLVFLDPPTTSRSKRMQQSFDVQRDHAELLRTVAGLLEPGGAILFSCNYQRFRLDLESLGDFVVEDLSRATLPEDFRRNPRIHVAYLLRPRGRSD
ncbi:MAG TPA: bifunctional 23S rRNA (guanine(2069)-N(7))-methyltransferase RlmK/23S rRNA (guanine(2445)-N(2))-methyltransferase RlmL [Steroidobacteraceae bacterium]|nr:bifunctional 23S rRNA (guanine(2069)-N(7))-methyltransferase RlmK/23S rRNA (guanine(2445)-N(2))-methyltransferase RlmL [Steroidobacteraceae bacterium]